MKLKSANLSTTRRDGISKTASSPLCGRGGQIYKTRSGTYFHWRIVACPNEHWVRNFCFLVRMENLKSDQPQRHISNERPRHKLGKIIPKNKSYERKNDCKTFNAAQQRCFHISRKFFSGQFIYFYGVFVPKNRWTQFANIEKENFKKYVQKEKGWQGKCRLFCKNAYQTRDAKRHENGGFTPNAGSYSNGFTQKKVADVSIHNNPPTFIKVYNEKSITSSILSQKSYNIPRLLHIGNNRKGQNK